MPLAHLFAQGIGPFKKIHVDLATSAGEAHVGPHIIAGVNGSGKSTLLRAITWALAVPGDGFSAGEWEHFLAGYPVSRVLLVFNVAGLYKYCFATTNDLAEGWLDRLQLWVHEGLQSVGLHPSDYPVAKTYEDKFKDEPEEASLDFMSLTSHTAKREYRFNTARFGGPEHLRSCFNAAAYSSARSIHYIQNPAISVARGKSSKNRFAFDSTVQNDAVQAWILSLYSKRAIARERRLSGSRYKESLEAFERGLSHICGSDVWVDVEIEPALQPSLHAYGKRLNFSQIPDGVKTTLGLLADYMMRSDAKDWEPTLGPLRPGLLLLDEIDAYLHPLWQRRLLPAMRDALPEAQILVTSHSPFVISSCPGSIVHVLRIDKHGYAYAEPRVNAPIGESITTTLKDIFGVSSRFDVQTETELAEWNELNKLRVHGHMNSKQRTRYTELQKTLSARSEELRMLVDPVRKLPKTAVDSLVRNAGSSRKMVRESVRDT